MRNFAGWARNIPWHLQAELPGWGLNPSLSLPRCFPLSQLSRRHAGASRCARAALAGRMWGAGRRWHSIIIQGEGRTERVLTSATAPAEILGRFQGLLGRQLYLVAGLAFSQLDPGGCLLGSDSPWSGGSSWVSWACGLLHTPLAGDRAAPAPLPLPGLFREG